MNILHVISSPASGGAEVYVKDLSKHLSQQHNLHVAFLSAATDTGRDTEYERVFLEDLQFAGVSTYIIGNETRKKPWLGALRLKTYIKNNKIDIVHTHLAYGIVFSALSQVPVVYTHHNITQRWGETTYKIFNILVNEYVGISDICATALSKYTGKKVNTIFNAVSLDKFEGYSRTRTLSSISTNIINVAMVGALHPQKNYLNMLNALTLLDKEIRDQIIVLIAGEGEKNYKDELLSYIEKHNLQNTVRFIGVTSNIPQFLYDADLFVMSSDWEGLPIALTEAAISGLPCIVTNAGGCSEIIDRSKNGVVVPLSNPQALANEISKVIISKSLIEQWSQNAINSAEQYSINKAADLHINLYNSILSKKSI
ncbi:glycosyltransferase [Psychrobacter sp. APC 3281]|uniref:glycosyltransferase n=1 Tax=Psychrobacter sp. APC 3281 TaxID=3035190 RepID=UPI0025B3FCCC|nr:glycosyltransferase [Psychrobacter sp. APC 3281]MDN3448462.1 glycosyltransferase [Psychrobacter sp. APC 3281]